MAFYAGSSSAYSLSSATGMLTGECVMGRPSCWYYYNDLITADSHLQLATHWEVMTASPTARLTRKRESQEHLWKRSKARNVVSGPKKQEGRTTRQSWMESILWSVNSLNVTSCMLMGRIFSTIIDLCHSTVTNNLEINGSCSYCDKNKGKLASSNVTSSVAAATHSLRVNIVQNIGFY